MRRRLFGVLVAAAVSLLLFGSWGPAPASAAAPVKYGWWNQANVGLGFSPSPPQVPSDGMYVENGYSGPVAISAVTFDVPAGAAVGPITLHIAGNPVVTSPPFACPVAAASLGYKPAEGGRGSDAPMADCSKAKVTGKVSSNNTTVTFDAGSLLAGGVVAAVIEAGGPADQIAFDKPGPDALTVTPAGSGSGAAVGATGPAPYPSAAPAPSPSGGGTGGSAGSAPAAPSGGSGAALTSPSVAPSTGALSAPAASGPSAPPAAGGGPAGPAPSQAGSSGAPAAGRGGLASSRGSGSGTAWKVLALVGLIGVLVAYTEGYGLLGGRVLGAGSGRRLRPQMAGPAGTSSEA